MMKQENENSLGYYSGEELLLLNILGSQRVGDSIDRELDQRAYLGMQEEMHRQLIQSLKNHDSDLAILS